MSGKICDGNANSGLEIRNSKAYCEGMLACQQNLAATANPYDGTGMEEETAWDAGYNAADAYSGSTMPVSAMGCCAINPSIPA